MYKIMKHKNLEKGVYEAPRMQELAVSVEAGFATSGRSFDNGSISSDDVVTNDYLNL